MAYKHELPLRERVKRLRKLVEDSKELRYEPSLVKKYENQLADAENELNEFKAKQQQHRIKEKQFSLIGQTTKENSPQNFGGVFG